MRVAVRNIAYVGFLLVCALVAGAVPARAAAIPVRAGDTIVQGAQKCTLGYVYRWAGSTMGLTAGHCAVNADITVIDREAGAVGASIGASSVTTRRQDWQVIDFGDMAWSRRIRGTHYLATGRSAAIAGQEICHYGVGSNAVMCGTTLDVNGSSITVSAGGKAGDSGGPCFGLTGTDEVTVVGLWHGHDADIANLGFCVSIDSALWAFEKSTVAMLNPGYAPPSVACALPVHGSSAASYRCDLEVAT